MGSFANRSQRKLFYECKYRVYLPGILQNVKKNIVSSPFHDREPNIKRTICKRCGNILRPGTSADCSIDPKNRTVCCIECGKCKFIKRFTINAKYKLWLDDPAAITATISAKSCGRTVLETVGAHKKPSKSAPMKTRTDEPVIFNKTDYIFVQTENTPND